MGTVFRPEPLPPGWEWMTPAQKHAWYERVRADAVRRRNEQATGAGGLVAIVLGVLCAAVAWGLIMAWGLK